MVVCPARGANAVAVAEYVIATVLTLFRGTHDVTTRVIAGEWPRESSAGREAAGRVLGLVGLGDIARAVAARAGALGMRLQAHDPYVAADDPVWRALDVDNVALDTLLAGSDVVSLHVPLTDETRGLIDAAAFARMKPGALLVNTTRGGTVDEAALVAVLKEGRLGGAALDVFAEEPLTAAAGAKFRDVPNLILTPHIAGVTEESNRRISEVTIANVLRVLDEGG